MQKKHIILDRDGVINIDSKDYIKHPDEWFPLPRSLDAISLLKKNGFIISVATNQSGIGRGYYDREALSAIHAKMHLATKGQIDHLVYCPHLPTDACECRKPKPGLLQQLHSKYGVSLSGTAFVGDSLTDMQAALAAHCLPILVLTGNGEKTRQKQHAALQHAVVVKDLWEAANNLVNQVEV